MPGPATAYQTGTHASRPANGAGCILYSCTTHSLVYLDNGSSWSTFLTLPSAGGSGTVTTVEEVDGSPTDSAITKIVFPNGTLGIASHVATYTPAAGSGLTGYSLSPSSDTHIDDQNATTNNDTSTGITVGNAWGTASFTRFGLLTFDVSALAAKTVASAVLHLTGTGSGSGWPARFQIREVLRAYSPTQATWNVYSTGNNWTTAGGQGSGTDIGADYYGDGYIDHSTGSLAIDITRLVQQYATASTSTLRVMLGSGGTTGGNAVVFGSLNNATADRRPVLRVVAA